MKFEQALEGAIYKYREQNPDFTFLETRTAQILAFCWNMMAVAENKLDDFAFVNNDNTIISVPLSSGTSAAAEGKPETETTKPEKAKSGKGAKSEKKGPDMSEGAADNEEKQEETESESDELDADATDGDDGSDS